VGLACRLVTVHLLLLALIAVIALAVYLIRQR
jgi:hypothetical protein